ncbi:O-antigen ligase family protein [Micromonospora sp. NPDC126480]|uniref:O-antigen ligase family protein n=1 Tax=Micromonospora sp. NPDC126480 TaxID=3155312 RepID=UPI00331C6E00
MALAGRATPERLGLPMGGDMDLRIPGCAALFAAALLWQISQSARGQARQWPRMFHLFTALIALQISAAFWAPSGARIEQATWDLLSLWILVLITVVFSAGDPRRAARILLALLLAAGIAYAVAALVTGPQLGGRYSAFGGGPNIFVRVVALGIIASVGLFAISRKWWLLIPLPLLAAAAVLSGSRGGLVALVGAATAFFVLFARRRFVLLVGTLVIGGAVSWGVWSLVGARFEEVAERRYSTTGIQQGDFSARPELLSHAWEMFKRNPITGAGMDSFQVEVGFGYPHNYFAGLAAETGLVAILLAVLVIGSWWRQGRRWSAAPGEQITCAVGAIYVLLASMFSGDYFDTRFCWILAVVAVLGARPKTYPSRNQMEIPPWHHTSPRRGASSF